MLDFSSTQGASLRQMHTGHPRLIAVVHNGEHDAEMPMLWHLCSALDELNYNVLALDGSSHETSTTSGLAELLQHGIWPQGWHDARWNTLSAASGLQALLQDTDGPAERLNQLARRFADRDVLVIYASSGVLIDLIGHTGASPLLLAQADARSVLNCYQTLKYLWSTAGLWPTVASMVDPSDLHGVQRMQQCHASLRDCVRQHLGLGLATLTVRYPSSLLWPSEEICSLALRLVETGLYLNEPVAAPAAHTASRAPTSGAQSTPHERYARSH